MHRHHLLLGALSGVALSGAAFAACVAEPYSAFARYNEVFSPACHNCYETQYSPSLYSALDSARTIEIDFFDAELDSGSFGAIPGHWYVRHNGDTGNVNNCSSLDGENDLRACLTDVRRWSDDNKGHDVITVILDKKQDWGPGRQPVDLDTLIEEVFDGRGRIFTPEDLRLGFRTLRASAREGGWPTMDALKDKVLFVMSGGRLFNHNATQSHYVEQRGGRAILFVSPDANEKSDITGTPDQFSSSAAQHVVFYNLQQNDNRWGSMIRSLNYVGRNWGSDGEPFCDVVDRCVHFNALHHWEGESCGGLTRGVLGQELIWYESVNYDTGVQPDVAINRNDWTVEVHKSQSADTLWYTVGRPNGRRLLGADAIQYDDGREPSVSIDASGRLVEVHRGHDDDDLWYHVGRVIGNNRIDWGPSRQYGTGRRPSVAHGDDGVVVEVHQSESFDTLWYHVGTLAPDDTIQWGPSVQYDTGIQPSVAYHADVGRVVEVHQSENAATVWYRLGTVVGNSIVWTGSVQYDTGRNPSVAMDDSGRVLEVHEADSRDHLWFTMGQIVGDTIVWGAANLYDEGVAPAIGLSPFGVAVEVHESESLDTLWYHVGERPVDGQ